VSAMACYLIRQQLLTINQIDSTKKSKMENQLLTINQIDSTCYLIRQLLTIKIDSTKNFHLSWPS
jgi:hypothetical protein